jgi:transcriptional regulator with XRE-family HTH domain
MTPLRTIRVERLLTIRRLARMAGVSPTTIHAVERGERPPSLNTISAVSFALGVPPGDIAEFQRSMTQAVTSGKGPDDAQTGES